MSTERNDYAGHCTCDAKACEHGSKRDSLFHIQAAKQDAWERCGHSECRLEHRNARWEIPSGRRRGPDCLSGEPGGIDTRF